MESRGRGIRGKRRGEEGRLSSSSTSTTVPATPVSTAWADFMREEGMGGSSAAAVATMAAATTTTATATTPATTTTVMESPTKLADIKIKKKTTKVETGTQRHYALPLEKDWLVDSKPSKSKKSKTSTKKVVGGGGGVLVQTGTLDCSSVGRTKRQMNQSYDLFHPTVLEIDDTQNADICKVITSSNACHSLAITTTGKVYGWGRNESQQLTQDLPVNVGTPTLLDIPSSSSNNKIIDGAVGKSHTLLLDDQGQVWSVGSNKCGQCGIKSSIDLVSNFRKAVVLGKNVFVVQVSCGEQFSVALSSDGHLYTTGSSEFGQLGNGETGEYFVTASKLAFANCNLFTRRSVFCHSPGEKNYGGANDAKVVPLVGEDIALQHVACGKNHTVAIEASCQSTTDDENPTPPRVFTWGCGDYGCLGHGKQADEYYPRLLGFLSTGHLWDSNNAVSSAAGAHCSMVLTERGHVYYWGKHRSVGEATMRPSLLEELANNGHIVTHVDGGAQTVVCSTANAVTVSWGQGPHGELGYGPDQKSSSRPKFVSSLDKCRIMDMSCGYGHTLFVIQNDDQDDKEAIQELHTLDESTLEELQTLLESSAAQAASKAAAVAEAKAAKGRSKKR
mmetsp:Transcript_1884/g.2631  ORF Transcript_1884/g.2631 Transcript_1884/m.2631 type:complete len:617 (+) Transcript_1884:521-2371(+)